MIPFEIDDNVLKDAHKIGSLAAPRVVGQQFELTVNNYPRGSHDTIGMEAVAATVNLKEAIQVDAGQVEHYLQEKMRGTIEEMMNKLLDAEADAFCQAQKYQRTAERQTPRSGSYQRKLQTTVGEVNLKMPRLRSFPFDSRWSRLSPIVQPA